MTSSGATVLVEALQAAGVERLFSLSGNQIMSVYDACLGAGLDILHVRHEAAAVHMADAWGRLTGRPGVALLTAGPGHANALSALFVAAEAEAPLVVLSGRSAAAEDGRGAFQEMSQSQIAEPLVKAAWTATDPAQLGHDIARALRLAVAGRPGPVHLSLPVDVLEGSMPESAGDTDAVDASSPATAQLADGVARRALQLLAAAERPLILAGPALTRTAAQRALRGLETATQIPVIATESPRGINDPSLGAIAEVIAQADVILLLGKKLDHTLRFGATPAFDAAATFVQIDPDAAVLEQTGRNLDRPERLAMAAIADAVPAAERLASAAADRQWPPGGWRDEAHAAAGHRPPAWEHLESPADGPLHPVELARALQPWVEDGVFVSDGGEFGQWAQASLNGADRLINGPAGSIGTTIPFALAARLARPDRPIVATQGDGAFGFHVLEYDTAVRYGLPFVAVVGNDAAWNAEKQIQRRTYGADREYACDLLPTRYDQVVTALGGHGEHVTRPDQLAPALERSFASGLPSCVNVAIEPLPAPVIRREARAGSA